jgi:hypothetical protein
VRYFAKKLQMLRWIIFLLFVAILEIYAFQAFRTLIKSKWFFIIYYITSALAIVFIIYQLFHFDRKVGQTPKTMLTFGLLLLLYLPKLLLTIILFGEDMVRFVMGLFSWATKNNNENFLPERRKFVSKVALGIAAIPFVSLLYGVTLGKYCFVGAGSVVTKDVPPFALVVGNPAVHKGWYSEKGFRLQFDESGTAKCESGDVYELKSGEVSKKA